MMTRGHFFMVNFRIGDVPAVQVAGSWVCFLGSCVPFLAFPWNFVKFISRRSLPWLPLLMPWGCPCPSLSWGLYWGYVPPVPSSCCERCRSQKLSSASLHFNKLHLKKIIIMYWVRLLFQKNEKRCSTCRAGESCVLEPRVWKLESFSSRLIRVTLCSLFSSYRCGNAKYTELLAFCAALQSNVLPLCFRLASITCLLSAWRSKYII